MAAQLSANPMVWHAGDTIPTVFFTGSCKLRHIEFDKYTGATDSVTLQDINGKGEIVLVGDADLEQVRTGNVGWMTGLKLTAASLATTGEVTIFFE